MDRIMMQMADQTAAAKVTSAVEMLRRKFVDGLDDRLLRFEAVLAYARQGGDTRQALREISAMTHKIAGIAPSFGYEGIGQQARQIEMAIDRHIDTMSAEVLLNKITPVLEKLLERLESLLEA